VRAVFAREPGGPEVLELREVDDLEPGPGEVLLDVVATAVNKSRHCCNAKASIHRRQGASDVLGLECSGRVAAARRRRHRSGQVGDDACALLAGGGYATQVVVPAGQLLA
jgi:NADPH:quinone reductase-like Zn-dependent oxidoreductase